MHQPHSCPSLAAVCFIHVQKLAGAKATLVQNHKRRLTEAQQEMMGQVVALEQRFAAKKHKSGHSRGQTFQGRII